MKKLLFFIFFAAGFLNLFPQKGDFLKNFTEGNYLFLEKNYHMALKSYEQAFAIDSTHANVNYKIAVCYMNLPSKKKLALRYIMKAVGDINKNYDEDNSRESAAPPDAIFYYGRALHLSDKYEEAIAQFEKYKQIIGSKNKERNEEIERHINACKNAIVMSKDPEKITIKNLGDSINTEYPEYGPIINADETMLMFTSRRPGSTGGELGPDGNFYEDIYLSKRKDDGYWSFPHHLITGINSSSNEATVGLSPDGQRVYLYKDENGGDIYYSNLNGEYWSAPVAFGEELNSEHWETHVTISADTNTIYFSSNRPGGYGGLDIYRSTRLPNNKWSHPFNLGPNVNTKYNEDAPYLDPYGKKMFFSSEGHNSIGGLDIFYTNIGPDSLGNAGPTAPISLRMPINTPDDDEFYVPTTNGLHAYFSSARDGGFGDQDIYIADLPKEIQVDPLVLLLGYVTFDGGHDRPDKTEISVFDNETKERIALCKPNSATGKYLIILNPGPLGKKYTIRYEAPGFQPATSTINVLPGSAYQVIEKEVELAALNMVTRAEGTISLGGTITNENGESIVDVQVVVKDNNTGALISSTTTSSDIGFYYIELARGKNYNISFEAPGYLFQSKNVNIPAKTDYVELFKNVVLEHFHEGAKMVLNNIFFDKNKSVLSKQSMVEMETVYKMLKANPKLELEISGHTDDKGKDALNNKLSLARAQAVVTYLTKKGIPKKQLVAKGYGKTQPVADNNNPDGTPNLENMQLNRRVEMKILNETK